MDRLTGQTRLNLGEPRKKMVSDSVKRLRLEPQDNKTQVSKLMLGNFFPIINNYYFFVMILQILMSVKESTLVT